MASKRPGNCRAADEDDVVDGSKVDDSKVDEDERNEEPEVKQETSKRGSK